jgi:hypothetical protein
MRYEQTVLEMFLHNILNGFSPFVFNGKVYLAKHISSADIFEANCYCISKKERLKKAGCATEYDILKDCMAKNIWTRDKDSKIEHLEKVIRNKIKTKEKLVLPSQVAQIDGEINMFVKELSAIKAEKQELLLNSLEYKMLLEKRDYLAYVALYNKDKKKVWSSFDDFLDNDADFIEKLTNHYYEVIGENTNSIIRAIARDTDARYKLKISPMPQLEQLSVLFCELKQWCDFYTSIYELSDKPDDETIMDDSKLDKWLIARRFRNESQNSVNSNAGQGFTGIVGSRDDVDALGGISNNMVKDMAKIKNG